MKLLVLHEGRRHQILIPGTASVAELKEKIQVATQVDAEQQRLVFEHSDLCDEMTLAEQGVQDRDRVDMVALSSKELKHTLASIAEIAAEVEGLVGSAVHEELFTRLLEKLDAVSLQGCVSRIHLFTKYALALCMCAQMSRDSPQLQLDCPSKLRPPLSNFPPG